MSVSFRIGLAALWAVVGVGLTLAGAASRPRVEIMTSEGEITIELYPDLAPETVARFLQRAGLEGAEPRISTPVRYAGSEVCESWAHGFLVFGCAPPRGESPKPAPSGDEPPLPDEIDGAAMGLDAQGLGDDNRRQLLWQLEIYPRYQELAGRHAALPPGLEALIGAVRRQGMAATGILDGKSRRWYLEAQGFRYGNSGSPLRVTRGVLATASIWPDSADERFLVALADLPERDGRATVFGRVLEGLTVLDRSAALPVSKSHVPLEPIKILEMRAVTNGERASDEEDGQ